jgi:hypothetical protein
MGPMQVLDANLQPWGGSALQVVRDPLLDTLVIGINRQAIYGIDPANPTGSELNAGIGMGFKVQVFLTPAGSTSLADELGPSHSQALPPPPAQVVFAFWNTYLAYTPATALRRWDGAHTGPAGGRHGLYNLLRTAQAAGVPLALLDLKNPASHSALDYAGKRALINEMLASGLLILPEFLPDPSLLMTESEKPLAIQQVAGAWGPAWPGWVYDTILEQNQTIAQDFGLSPSPFVFSPSGPVTPASGTRLTFILSQSESPAIPELQPVTASRWRDQLVLPIPQATGSVEQATVQGPSIEVRRALIGTALASGESRQDGDLLLVLGGNLPDSAWGNPQAARETFRYLASRPWIRPLNAVNLLGVRPAASASPTRSPESALAQDELLTALRQAPENALGRAAWQCWQALYMPVHPTSDDLPALRTEYVVQVWSLLAAAQWAEAPIPLAGCDSDPDHDGQAECILASEKVFALLEIESGALAFAFAHDPAGITVHQIVGPSSQFITGLSDPSFWKLEDGVFADPTVIYGAFAEPGVGYTAAQEDGVLTFTSTNSQMRKAYQLTEDGLRVEFQGLPVDAVTKLQLPLALDPWKRFASGWADRYQLTSSDEGWVWQLDPNVEVLVQSSIPAKTWTFLDSRPYFTQTEDPNQDPPTGHFLVFPLAMVNFTAQQDFFVEINLRLSGD